MKNEKATAQESALVSFPRHFVAPVLYRESDFNSYIEHWASEWGKWKRLYDTENNRCDFFVLSPEGLPALNLGQEAFVKQTVCNLSESIHYHFMWIMDGYKAQEVRDICMGLNRVRILAHDKTNKSIGDIHLHCILSEPPNREIDAAYTDIQNSYGGQTQPRLVLHPFMNLRDNPVWLRVVVNSGVDPVIVTHLHLDPISLANCSFLPLGHFAAHWVGNASLHPMNNTSTGWLFHEHWEALKLGSYLGKLIAGNNK